MPLIAFIVLAWQRRRVLSLLREARVRWSASRREAGAPRSTGAFASRLAARAFRAVDTPENASRVQRLLDRARAAAARSESGSAAPAA